MARKSRADVLSERHGGKWKFDYLGTWFCDDGIRKVYREVRCNCWQWKEKDDECTCKPVYVMDDGEKTFVVDLSDPRIYKLNGMATYEW